MPINILKYFNLLYDPIHFPIEIINKEGKIVYVNPAFIYQWDYNFSELKEYSIFNDSEIKNNKIIESINYAFETKTSVSIDNYTDSLLKSKQITKPIFRTKIFYISLNSKDYVVLIHEDETEVVLMNEEFNKARDSQKEADRLKNNFLNVLSHELRTPLNIILGYSSIIKESMKDKISPEDRVYLDNLYSGSERLFKSITQMLEFAQIEAENYKLNFETINLITILQSCIASTRENAKNKNVEINSNFNTKEIYVSVDIQTVENIFNNLLNNAIKFTKQGFVEVETNLLLERELAVVRIKDSGVGISAEYMDHLFQPFSQEDLNIGRNYEGNGLGLALSKRYLEKMGGSLLVDSIKGVGTTVTFTLPLSPGHTKKKKIPEGDKKVHLKKILMLDDSSDSYGLINAFLKKSFEIEVYNFGDFQLEMLNKKDYRIIVFDVNPNRWNESVEICKEIKNYDSYNRPLIIISSEFAGDRIREFYEAGADKFLVKPFSKNELVKSLEELNA
ncbi:MAG: ATP-binding protein [Ignavibacteriaceae bacterium]